MISAPEIRVTGFSSDDLRQSMDDEPMDPTARKRREVGSDLGLSTLAAHLYRGEMERAVTWRQRLDSTTNFAVTIMGAILAYAFAGQGAGHTTVLVAMIVGVTFLLIEANRYRKYDIWRSRVRSLQENLFANALDPTAGVEQDDWRKQLSEDYRRPAEKMSYVHAVAHRLRRVYLPILIGLLAIWLFHLSAYGDAGSWVADAAIQNVPGYLVLGVVGLSYAGTIALALIPHLNEEPGDGNLGDLEARR